MTVLRTLLIANRGEIAVRVMRTARRLGIRTVAVHSDADAGALHVRTADVAVGLPGAPLAAYLDIPAVLAAAARTGADAVHPGYGFLSENAAFARACTDAGLVFVGPPAAAIEAMGDKIGAKRLVEAAGVPVVPGRHTPGLTDADLTAAAAEIGFPVLLKPSAGGGGKGMHRVDGPPELAAALATARREAAAAFGNDELLIERYVEGPRHVEIQVLADAYGAVVHLGERECSLQRRHQKVVEEAPSALLSPELRAAMGEQAVQVARACGYSGAGTVEFVLPAGRPQDYAFLEMNTRLQVEHPVTEMVTGLDLVEEQLRIAAGEPLRIGQQDVQLRGHAVEARVYAEDPGRGFLPSTGRILALSTPYGPDVRVDAGVDIGAYVGTAYDPLLAKVIAWGPDRAAALRRLDSALADSTVLGVTTNTGFLRALLADPDVRAGRLDTHLIERRLPDLVGSGVPDDALAAAALGWLAGLEPDRDPDQRADPDQKADPDPHPHAVPADPFAVPSGWRVGGPAWTRLRLQLPDGGVVPVAVRGRAAAAQVRIRDDPAVPAEGFLSGTGLVLTAAGVTTRWSYARRGRDLWVGRDGSAWRLREADPVLRPERAPASGAGPLVAPMPGTVTAVHVAVGAAVVAGAPVVTVEAMKMEHVVRAPGPGRVAQVLVRPGQTVALEAPLAVLEPLPAADPPASPPAPAEAVR